MRQVFFTFLLLMSLLPIASAQEPFVLHESSSSYDDVMEGLRMAIEDKGMTINNTMHLSEMLDRTGKDLGETTPIYTKAESVEFCSALLSRKMMATDPTRIINCPYIISVYTLPGKADTTYVIHRRVNLTDSSEIMNEVEAMLEDLAKTAIEGW